ncbi:MAG: hypothetical protein NZL93_02920, partial [Chthoniobacterales bacterium]|nr:hypothetical protein [Chthoniobacterales bacterium]
HILTGIPKNNWNLRLEPFSCLDFSPIKESEFCIRFYGFFDSFRGSANSPETFLLGQPLLSWLEKRQIHLSDLTQNYDLDIQFLPLFPVLPLEKITPHFIEWLTSSSPIADTSLLELWKKSPRLSAEQIPIQFSPQRLFRQRQDFLLLALPRLASNHRWNPFYRLDLASTASLFVQTNSPLPDLSPSHANSMDEVRHAAFCAAVLRSQNNPTLAADANKYESKAFALLRERVLEHSTLTPCDPHLNLLEDQILWARSPARVDLAGGWTDTPPHCLFHGGAVVNIATNLNGQPPIQVFIKSSQLPQIVLRSIDLGVECKIQNYSELEDFSSPHSEFSLAKAALALAGFLPRFHKDGCFATLRELLENFGGGLEITLLAAIPKGSGLGTSSILAATLLAALSSACSLNWDLPAISSRTLALEQLLTTGGGWQDQIGGITRGIKLIETEPGFAQSPHIRWLPDHLLSDPTFQKRSLLYYTGITRMAKNILREIVRSMFLNSSSQLRILNQIHQHALSTYQILQSGNWKEFCQAISHAWKLKQQLDSGTNPPAVQSILQQVAKWTAAATMPGAGGGGYLLLLAHDEDAAASIRRELETNPPNSRARFINFSLSPTGLEITRS